MAVNIQSDMILSRAIRGLQREGEPRVLTLLHSVEKKGVSTVHVVSVISDPGEVTEMAEGLWAVACTTA